jgi:Ca-activated chloride channel family protein
MPTFASAGVPSTPKSTGLVAVDGRTFPLRAARLRSQARAGFAATTLTQEYANPYAEPLEVLYTMPLPADGAVVGYTFRLGERVVRGTIETREKAAEDYRHALMEGKTAGLLEQERADTFTQSLGNVPGGAEVVVEIEVLHPLAFLPGGLWEWRFPTVVGVRYQGAPGEVPDAERLDVDRASGDGTPVRVDVEVAADGEEKFACSGRLDRDVVFTWSASGSETDARLVEGRGLPGDDGRYAILTITPPVVPAVSLARDLTMLVDASGSMAGAPLDAAKAVVDELLASLAEGDRFELLAFSDDVRPLTRGMVAANAGAVAAAREALHVLRAGGGTEMSSAVEKALAPLRGDAQRQVVLITDGDVGFEAKVTKAIRSGLPAGSRLHVVGVGAAPNRTLTRSVSRMGRGLEVLVGLGDDARAAAARLVRGTAAPVLTEIAMRGHAVRAVAPGRMRDVFAGAPTSVFLELASDGGIVEVEGRLAGSSEPWRRRFEVGPQAGEDAGIPVGALLGRELVEDAEAWGDDGSIEANVEALGLRHRIVTRRTSLVAISEDPTVDPRDPRRRERLAVELPYGVSAEGVGLSGATGQFRVASRSRLAMDPGAPEEMTLGASVPPRRGARWLSRLIGSPASVPQIEIRGRLLSFDADEIVFELEVPEGSMDIPVDGYPATVGWDQGPKLDASFKALGHTRPGLYAAGLTVRVRLVFERAPQSGAKPVLARWVDPSAGVIEVRFA